MTGRQMVIAGLVVLVLDLVVWHGAGDGSGPFVAVIAVVGLALIVGGVVAGSDRRV